MFPAYCFFVDLFDCFVSCPALLEECTNEIVEPYVLIPSFLFCSVSRWSTPDSLSKIGSHRRERGPIDAACLPLRTAPHNGCLCRRGVIFIAEGLRVPGVGFALTQESIIVEIKEDALVD